MWWSIIVRYDDEWKVPEAYGPYRSEDRMLRAYSRVSRGLSLAGYGNNVIIDCVQMQQE